MSQSDTLSDEIKIVNPLTQRDEKTDSEDGFVARDSSPIEYSTEKTPIKKLRKRTLELVSGSDDDDDGDESSIKPLPKLSGTGQEHIILAHVRARKIETVLRVIRDPLISCKEFGSRCHTLPTHAARFDLWQIHTYSPDEQKKRAALKQKCCMCGDVCKKVYANIVIRSSNVSVGPADETCVRQYICLQTMNSLERVVIEQLSSPTPDFDRISRAVVTYYRIVDKSQGQFN